MGIAERREILAENASSSFIHLKNSVNIHWKDDVRDLLLCDIHRWLEKSAQAADEIELLRSQLENERAHHQTDNMEWREELRDEPGACAEEPPNCGSE